jgi:dethiobiotin synthetase
VKVVVIAGTGTGVGKTVVTAGLAALISEQGFRVAVVKPYQTGVGIDEPGDLAEIERLSGVSDVHEFARFAEPLAPATAARRAGVDAPEIDEVARQIMALGDRDFVLVEGSGGLLVHFNRFRETLLDLVMELDRHGDVLVWLVASAGLGSLNAAALTARAMDEATGEPIGGVVVGDWPAEPDLAARCNLSDLPRYADAPLVGVFPMGASRLHRPLFLALARAAFTPSMGGTFDAPDFIQQNSAPLPSLKGHHS